VRVRSRGEGRSTLAAHGIESSLRYTPPLHLQPVYAHFGHGLGAFPVAERLAGELLCQPIYPELTDDDARRVARELVKGTP